MTTEVESPSIPHVVIEVELRVPLAIPRLLVTEALEKDPSELTSYELTALVDNDPDRFKDAIDEYLATMPSLAVELGDDIERPLPAPFNTIRPGDRGPFVIDDPDNEGESITVAAPTTYDGPAPSFLERLNFTADGIVLATESPANGLSDEQARGALWALRQAWNLPDMNRRQRARLVLFLSELEWICCSRPSLHFFKASDEDATICSYCGTGEPGHDVKKEQSRVEEAQAEPSS